MRKVINPNNPNFLINHQNEVQVYLWEYNRADKSTPEAKEGVQSSSSLWDHNSIAGTQFVLVKSGLDPVDCKST